MNKIKIAFIIDTIGENLGGTERQLLLLLQNLDYSRFDPHLCYFRESDWPELNKRQWKTHQFTFKSFLSPIDYWRLFKFSRYLVKEEIDIVQTHFRDGNIVGILTARTAGISKIISTRRNQGYWHTRTEIILLKIINGWVHRFLANSESVKKYVADSEHIPLEKIDVIYNGFDISGLRPVSGAEKHEICHKLNIDPKQPIITMTANLRPVKGHAVFLKAAKWLLEKYGTISFLLVGDGQEMVNLQKMCVDLDITPHVYFLGSRSDIYSILSVSTIGVLTSHSEGLSNAIIEYMAAGLPVVATRVGGNEELVEDGVNGYLVADNDHEQLATSINKVLTDSQRARRMGKSSYDKAKEKFELKKIINQMESYYAQLEKQ